VKKGFLVGQSTDIVSIHEKLCERCALGLRSYSTFLWNFDPVGIEKPTSSSLNFGDLLRGGAKPLW
jgi:hypothetical protein